MALKKVMNTRLREADAVRVELAADIADQSVAEFIRGAVLRATRETFHAARRKADRRQDRQERSRAER